MSIELYDAPEGCKVRVISEKIAVPPASCLIGMGDVLFFWHIDGMYAKCTNEDGVSVYPAAWTRVEVLSDEP